MVNSGQRRKVEHASQVHGIGRSVSLKPNYRKGSINPNQILDFEETQCFIREGSFLNGRLNQFGRSIRSDGKSYLIGFFNSDQLHGYGRVVDVKNALEGLFENGIYRKEKY